MKRTIAFLTSIMTLMSLTSCSGTPKDDNLAVNNNFSTTVLQETVNTVTTPDITSKTESQTTTSKAESKAVGSTDKDAAEHINTEADDTSFNALNSSDYVLNVSFTPVYDNVSYPENPIDGSPRSYEELQDFINSYGDTSFVEYEIISQYSPEEAFEKTGDDVFKYSSTLYQAHIYYDHLHDMPVDMTVYLGKAGMSDKQIQNDPPYSVGQKIISPLSGFNTESCVAIPELVYYVYEVNGIKLAYHVRFENIALESSDFVNLNMELIESERLVITTTANNPVKFTQKSTVDDLVHFIKQDWETREYDFFDVANFDYNSRSIQNDNEDEPVVE